MGRARGDVASESESAVALRDLLDAVHTLPCTYSRKQVLRALKGLAGRRLFIARRAVVAPDELALAAALMDERPMAEAVHALCVRLQCGKSKAYRLITAALQARSGVAPAAAHGPGRQQLALNLDDDGVADGAQ